ncbi:MAG: hypothetical protein RLZ29_432, partial [Actinomycetota bacterium]
MARAYTDAVHDYRLGVHEVADGCHA